MKMDKTGQLTQLKKKALADPTVRLEYEALEPEFENLRARLVKQIEPGTSKHFVFTHTKA
ncbi:hypothetical protein P3521_20085 [Vibrio parahaemolyticus]|uniref:hypothetical protein n=1 Tax=Vibrio parahaemolyticus TaxID=670 RepID=UPI00186A9410|nr:hypothetical protein [Vibrio parahaemolyticus]MBE3793538.1 hypothetical protein [Vibrio parahaemolyticus]MBE3866398.1 hypothetical protein [Vibrio parahaemolyticus]MCZ5880336.1 hypothetical protein [Vibrio parahaemolyticus]MDF4424227.1 hypothetical protein [Vibrio parahaemolyticus]MDF4582606.1 hypothetical protein [Vibrio parahaemolyticus]